MVGKILFLNGTDSVSYSARSAPPTRLPSMMRLLTCVYRSLATCGAFRFGPSRALLSGPHAPSGGPSGIKAIGEIHVQGLSACMAPELRKVWALRFRLAARNTTRAQPCAPYAFPITFLHVLPNFVLRLYRCVPHFSH